MAVVAEMTNWRWWEKRRKQPPEPTSECFNIMGLWGIRDDDLHPGDCDRNGNICTREGLALRTGKVWVTLKQAEVAEKFGWKRTKTVDGLVVVERPGLPWI